MVKWWHFCMMSVFSDLFFCIRSAQVTDGMQKIKAGLNLDLSKDAESGQLVEKCLVRITDYVVNKIGGNK
jgi:hypothetical protein